MNAPRFAYSEGFLRFHFENPHIYLSMVEMARQAKEAGHGTYSVQALFEVLRWERTVKTSGEIWKLNNNLRPEYARFIMEREGDLAGFFHIRERRGDG